jgi:hypothetical protein
MVLNSDIYLLFLEIVNSTSHGIIIGLQHEINHIVWHLFQTFLKYKRSIYVKRKDKGEQNLFILHTSKVMENLPILKIAAFCHRYCLFALQVYFLSFLPSRTLLLFRTSMYVVKRSISCNNSSFVVMELFYTWFWP